MNLEPGDPLVSIGEARIQPGGRADAVPEEAELFVRPFTRKFSWTYVDDDSRAVRSGRPGPNTPIRLRGSDQEWFPFGNLAALDDAALSQALGGLPIAPTPKQSERALRREVRVEERESKQAPFTDADLKQLRVDYRKAARDKVEEAVSAGKTRTPGRRIRQDLTHTMTQPGRVIRTNDARKLKLWRRNPFNWDVAGIDTAATEAGGGVPVRVGNAEYYVQPEMAALFAERTASADDGAGIAKLYTLRDLRALGTLAGVRGAWRLNRDTLLGALEDAYGNDAERLNADLRTLIAKRERAAGVKPPPKKRPGPGAGDKARDDAARAKAAGRRARQQRKAAPKRRSVSPSPQRAKRRITQPDPEEEREREQRALDEASRELIDELS